VPIYYYKNNGREVAIDLPGCSLFIWVIFECLLEPQGAPCFARFWPFLLQNLLCPSCAQATIVFPAFGRNLPADGVRTYV